MRPVRYVSTRGEAPPLGFVDVLLAGLARDGGLYVPESWPTLDGKTIAGFAGRPYAEVAVDVIRPFVGDAISEQDLARMAREAYGSFRHPAVAPLTIVTIWTFWGLHTGFCRAPILRSGRPSPLGAEQAP